MAKHLHFPLQAYLAGLGTATLLATTSNAAIVTMDVSSISGDNGGATGASYGLQVSLSTLTNGGLEGNLFLWDLHNGWMDDVGISGGRLTSDDPYVKIAYTGGKTSPKAFHDGDFVDENSQFTDDRALSSFWFQYSTNDYAESWGAGNYIGFFTDDGTDKHYGWLEVTWDRDTQIFHILSGAYESEANVGIPITPVPEPSSLALLAAGAAGVAALRCRKKAA